VDTVLARFMDVVLSLPFLLFAIALVAVVGPSLRVSILVIAFFSWAAVGRVIRGQTLSLREREFVEAARSLGASNLRIMFVDLLPNLSGPILVYTTLLIPVAIVFEATLSFLGLGVVPPTPSWGGMLADSLQYYQVAWWFVLSPDSRCSRRPCPSTWSATASGMLDPNADRLQRRPRTDCMLRFIARRLLLAAMVLWLVTVAVFVLFFVTPRSARVIAGRLATPRRCRRTARARARPAVPEQYGHFLDGCCTGISATRTTTPGGDAPAALTASVTVSLTASAAIISRPRHRHRCAGGAAAQRWDRAATVFGYRTVTDLSGRHHLSLRAVLPAPPRRHHVLPRQWLRTDHAEPCRLGTTPDLALADPRVRLSRDILRLTRASQRCPR
jgi:hypothetical protein